MTSMLFPQSINRSTEYVPKMTKEMIKEYLEYSFQFPSSLLSGSLLHFLSCFMPLRGDWQVEGPYRHQRLMAI
jgi:hypothetical protein